MGLREQLGGMLDSRDVGTMLGLAAKHSVDAWHCGPFVYVDLCVASGLRDAAPCRTVGDVLTALGY